jgi:peptidyl-Lys metalloendopeptidase
MAKQLVSELELVTPGIVKASDGVMLRLTLTNPTDEDLYVLAYETPLRGLERELFRIERDGEPIPYQGKIALRLGPSAKDWIRIAPGASVSAEVKLSASYNLQRGGRYSVKYLAYQHVISGDQELPVVDSTDPEAKGFTFGIAGATIVSDALGIEINGDIEVVDDMLFDRSGGTKGYINCSSPSTIASAQSTAQGRVANAYWECDSYNSWYRDWFGTTSSYVSTVRGYFANSYWALDGDITYDCTGTGCSSGVIAYVYMGTPYKIWICPAFWSQSSNFKAHAIAHETFHWYVVAGVDDWVYGYSNCLWLADNYPYYALDNADNYAYAADYAY